MSTNRQYELVYIVPGETSEDALAGLQTQVEGIVARLSGTIEKTENWGRRRLAYEIGPHKEGVYVLVQFAGSPELVKEIDRRLKVTDLVIRHLIVRIDEDLKAAERHRAGAGMAGAGRPALDTDEDDEATDELQAEA
jgi:small subunit ribosomal protein S6